MTDKAELLRQFRELTGGIADLDRQIAVLGDRSNALADQRRPVAW